MAETDSVIVEASDLWKAYETGKLKVEALRGINLKVRKGEMFPSWGHPAAQNHPFQLRRRP